MSPKDPLKTLTLCLMYGRGEGKKPTTWTFSVDAMEFLWFVISTSSINYHPASKQLMKTVAKEEGVFLDTISAPARCTQLNAAANVRQPKPLKRIPADLFHEVLGL